jgi:YebC/PmpR family DNA-binding regulatory protein
MCKAATDNRTRTAPEMRKLFERHGGNLGATNCVAWMFQQKGVIVVDREAVEEDKLMELALEAGAEDVSASERIYEVTCDPTSFEKVRDAIKGGGVALASADITMMPNNQITLDLENARKALALVEALEDHDDVQSVSSNFDIPEPVLAQLEKER